jgi:hypothetical protein
MIVGLLLGAAAFAAPAAAFDDPLTAVRLVLARAQRGERLSQMLASPADAALFTPDAASHVTAPPDFDAIGGEADAAPPRVLATRLLRRTRDQAFVQAALRERGKRGRVWTVLFGLKGEGALWRIDSADAAFERDWLRRLAPAL